jgi:hypothetical protein
LDILPIIDATLSEHRFWLQVLGDHARFIFYSLAPTESEHIQIAQYFMQMYDQLLESARKQLSAQDLENLTKQVLEVTYQFRSFKLHLLSLTLVSKIKVHLPSTFFNDMLNELDEYMLTLHQLKTEQVLFHPLHYHTLWLTDAVGHAFSVAANLDLVEKDLIEQGRNYEIVFADLHMKAMMLSGYLRTELMDFPSLKRLNIQVVDVMVPFMNYLDYIRDTRMEGRTLGTILPLMADHMAREECYYLWKLSQTTDYIRQPNCNPAKPRIET